VLHGDGGGKVRAVPRPVHGRIKVARLLLAGMRSGAPFGGWSRRQMHVNGQPGATLSDATGKPLGVVVLDVADGQIQAVRSIADPDKLRHLVAPTR
jgi:RNA polymerase sigma-70 factor (ECF subfamily)